MGREAVDSVRWEEMSKGESGRSEEVVLEEEQERGKTSVS